MQKRDLLFISFDFEVKYESDIFLQVSRDSPEHMWRNDFRSKACHKISKLSCMNPALSMKLQQWDLFLNHCLSNLQKFTETSTQGALMLELIDQGVFFGISFLSA